MPAEVVVLQAARTFLAERPGEWVPLRQLFPDLDGWSRGKNRLSCLCRLHFERVAKRGLLHLFRLESKSIAGGWVYRYVPRKPSAGQKLPSVLDHLLGERRRVKVAD
jgi:hypothetical protein